MSPEGPLTLHLAHGGLVQQTQWLTDMGLLGGFQLVYLDPPFFSGKDYVEARGQFTDRWASLDAYLETMTLWMKSVVPLLSPEGFFVLHCDAHASHYLKVAGDEVWGYPNFRNEWIWHYTGRRQPASHHVNAKHDVLLVWAKSAQAKMYPVFEAWDREQYLRMKRQKLHVDEEGREWIWGHQGRGKSHAYRIYLDEQVSRGKAIDTVWDIPIINTSSKERMGYPTQKPLALLDRVVALTTRTGDMVADLAAGSGTTGMAALRGGRSSWIGDVSQEAILVMEERLKGWTNADRG